MRQIVLDTETTGLDPAQGHRIIEIGCVELVQRRPTGNTFHQYIRPDRDVDEGAVEVHGITNAFLADKPAFADIVEDLLEFLGDAELVIHNAAFDVSFLDHELRLAAEGLGCIGDRCNVVDTLMLARRMHPGQKNSLDALCKRYSIDNSNRELHGALLDAEILADVYLAMTGGQASLALDPLSEHRAEQAAAVAERISMSESRPRLRVIRASDDERRAHDQRLAAIDEASSGNCLWRELDPDSS